MKKKQERYDIIAQQDNVLEPNKPLYLLIKNNWNKLYFKNSNPITLELACGRGEYTIGMATLLGDKNFVGVDRKGDRIWKGSTQAIDNGLMNVAFLRTSILDIENFFEKGEVSDIWLTFPDPRPKRRDAKRRLTHSRFLDSYKKILTLEGIVRLKTDNTGLFNYTIEELKKRTDIKDLEITLDLHQSNLYPECFDIETRYEKIFRAQGEKIKYLRFRFTHSSN